MTKENEENSLKPLFFGVLLGLGLAWFLSTPEGEDFKKKLMSDGEGLLDRAREAVNESLKENFTDEENVGKN